MEAAHEYNAAVERKDTDILPLLLVLLVVVLLVLLLEAVPLYHCVRQQVVLLGSTWPPNWSPFRQRNKPAKMAPRNGEPAHRTFLQEYDNYETCVIVVFL